MIKEIINDCTSFATAYKVENYPYGYTLRTTIYYWIETKKGKGDRFVSQTINPKNGKLNAPKASTYAPVMFMYKDENGHVKYDILTAYDLEKFRPKFRMIQNLNITLSQQQQENIRLEYYGHMRASMPYWLVKYKEESKEAFKNWCKETLSHIIKCEFEKLVSHEPAPAEDNPEGEVKMITTTSYIIG